MTCIALLLLSSLPDAAPPAPVQAINLSRLSYIDARYLYGQHVRVVAVIDTPPAWSRPSTRL